MSDPRSRETQLFQGLTARAHAGGIERREGPRLKLELVLGGHQFRPATDHQLAAAGSRPAQHALDADRRQERIPGAAFGTPVEGPAEVLGLPRLGLPAGSAPRQRPGRDAHGLPVGSGPGHLARMAGSAQGADQVELCTALGHRRSVQSPRPEPRGFQERMCYPSGADCYEFGTRTTSQPTEPAGRRPSQEDSGMDRSPRGP